MDRTHTQVALPSRSSPLALRTLPKCHADFRLDYGCTLHHCSPVCDGTVGQWELPVTPGCAQSWHTGDHCGNTVSMALPEGARTPLPALYREKRSKAVSKKCAQTVWRRYAVGDFLVRSGLSAPGPERPRP